MLALGSLLRLPTLESDLARVETALRRAVEAGDPFMTTVASHLIPAGGKRLRPALAVCVGSLASAPVSDAVIMGACAVELVHLGSLYHDDVMDEARTRRTVESVNARWGNLVAILAGDFLLARASEIAASLGTEVAGLLASTIGSLCEGQVRELSQAYDLGRTEEAYLTAINGKTAALMATACRIGALTGGLDRSTVEAVTRYGERVGMVFQIVDDILDVVASEEELGKPAGNDIVEGVYTLPVIRTLRSSGTSDALRALLRRHIEPAQVDEARRIIRSNGAVPASLDVARGYAGKACDALAELGDAGPEVDALRALTGNLIENVPA
ncbi:MAG: polyprenyl synthetase family protein [Acidimicrobiales bacterium]